MNAERATSALVMIVAVITGSVDVHFNGNAVALAAGESRAFAAATPPKPAAPPDYAVMMEMIPDAAGYRLPTEEEIKILGDLWPSVPPEENAAYLLAKANEELIAYCKQHEEPRGSLSTDFRNKPYEGDAAGFIAYANANRNVLATVEAALEKPFQVPCLIHKKTGTPMSPLPLIAGFRNLGRFLCDVGFAAELERNPGLAAERYLLCMRMGDQIRQGRCQLIMRFTGAAVRKTAAEQLHRLVANVSLSEATLRDLTAELRDAETAPSDLLAAFRAEAAYSKALLVLSPEQAAALAPTYDAYCAFMEEKLSCPLPDQLISGDDDREELAKRFPEWAGAGIQLVGALAQRSTRDDLSLRALQVRAAIALYTRARFAALRNTGEVEQPPGGTWVTMQDVTPQHLSQLVPAYLPEVPLDPFSGQPLRYELTDEGWWLWSVGPDMKDDGGRDSIVTEGDWTGPDYVFSQHVRPNIHTRSNGALDRIPQPQDHQ